MISLDAAKEILDDNVDFPKASGERVPLSNALNRVLAEDVFCDVDFPEFNKSAMDGYAVKAPANPGIYKVIEEIPAGTFPTKVIGVGEASRIMTGAPLPEGANAVIMVEKTASQSNGEEVELLSAAIEGENIRLQGEEIAKGTKVLSSGTLLRPQEIAVLASSGYTEVKVHAQLTAAVFSTGTELVNPREKPAAGQIRDSNGPNLIACCQQNNVETTFLGIIPDDKKLLRKTIQDGLHYDFLILSGGASVGDFDYVPDLFKEEGVEIFFYKVAIKPGKPIIIGKKGNCLIFALPGNPVSSAMNFHLFVQPAIKKRQGNVTYWPRERILRLASPYRRKKPGRRFFLPAMTESRADGEWVRLVFYKGSGHIHALTQSETSIIIPEECTEISEGDFVRVLDY